MTKRTRARKISPCYLLDFAVFKGPDDWKIDFYSAQEEAWKWDVCDRENYEFTRRVFERSGIGRIGSYLPPWLNPTATAAMGIQPRYDLDSAAEEARIVMVSLARDALKKAGLVPTDVDVLITASTVFSPVPSLASMVVNALKMREDVQAYNLGGMGCSNGVISLSLVRDLLQSRPNCVVLFIPAEIVTSALYIGHDRARMITNALFRAGGAAAVFTNRRDLKRRAKYELLHQERVHTGASDVAFRAMYYGPDKEGHTGIALTKDIPPEASKAIDRVLRVVTPRILTVPQYLDFAFDWCCKKLGIKGEKKAKRDAKRQAKKAAKDGAAAAEEATAAAPAAAPSSPPPSEPLKKEKVDPYAPPPRAPDEWLPDYTKCIDHFILHAGGYGVLKGIQKGMRLPSDTLLPSFATLRDIGNTSSSSTWYTFAYLESVSSGVRKGEKLLQLGVGGGMKAAAAVWKAMRDVEDTHPVWAHLDRRPVKHEELPRLIDESAETAKEITAAIARDAEELARARDEERERMRAAAALTVAAQAVASGSSSRADSAGEHEIERALPRPGQQVKNPLMVRDDSTQQHEQQIAAGKRGGAVVVPSEIAEASRAVEA